MSERKRVLFLISIMAAATLTVTGITLAILYRTSMQEQRERLVETVQSEARLIEAIARFDAVYSKETLPGGAREATLSQVIDAHKNYEQAGRTAEFTLAYHEGDNIVFLLRHRHANLKHPMPTKFDSKLAQPMRLALSGLSGTVIGLDYRGEVVLAAHEPVAELDFGIVAKIDLSELRSPFVKAGLMAGGLAILVVLAGTSLFLRITNPMIKRLEKRTVDLAAMNTELNREIEGRRQVETALHEAKNELELRVEERTAEIVVANQKLKAEIVERIRVELQVLQSKTMLQAVFDGIAEPLILVNRDMKIRMINRIAADYYGVTASEDIIDRFCYRAFKGRSAPCEGCEAPPVVLTGESVTFERKGFKDPDRLEQVVVYPVKDKHHQTGDAIIRISDITEARKFERQLIQSEKMASLGVLVTSIAHEINNPNNFISFNVPILRDYIQAMIPIIDEYAAGKSHLELCNMTYAEFRKDISNLLDNIEHGSGRINSVVSNLKEFSLNKDKKPPKRINIEEIIERVLAICQNKIKKTVKTFNKQIPQNMPLIYTDPYALEQILINLLVNAAQAADKQDSRVKLAVSVGNGETDHITIKVSDNGCGMDEQTRLKIFDPFFTTKSPAEGTGLGLYVCHNLIADLGGKIEVESKVGQDTVFKVILPAKGPGEKMRG